MVTMHELRNQDHQNPKKLTQLNRAEKLRCIGKDKDKLIILSRILLQLTQYHLQKLFNKAIKVTVSVCVEAESEEFDEDTLIILSRFFNCVEL